MDTLRQECRFALRSVVRSPGFALAAAVLAAAPPARRAGITDPMIALRNE